MRATRPVTAINQPILEEDVPYFVERRAVEAYFLWNALIETARDVGHFGIDLAALAKLLQRSLIRSALRCFGRRIEWQVIDHDAQGGNPIGEPHQMRKDGWAAQGSSSSPASASAFRSEMKSAWDKRAVKSM